ncbi:MAG: hypothetical protein ACT4NY_28335 [Pseudonocardiales bacterium]
MSRHRRSLGLLTILVRLGWQRDPTLWTVPCLDGHGRRARLSLRLGKGLVTVDSPAVGPFYLRPLQVGQLRAALREVIFDLGLLGGAELSGRPPRPEPAAGMVAAPRRTVLHWRPVARPTVADIQARLADATADPDPEVDHSEPAPLLSIAVA